MFGLVAGGIYFSHSHQAKQLAQTRTTETNNTASTPLPADGTTGMVIRGDNQVTGTNNSQSTQSQTPSTPAPTQTQNQGDKATLNPAEFGQYEKYKTANDAVFAEIVAGAGAGATSGKKLSVNYRGWLTNGSIFDQNTDATKPFVFTLGGGSVIKGWEQGIYGMKAGGERLVIVPPAVGYGNIPQGPIPANSVLVFYVKLLSVE